MEIPNKVKIGGIEYIVNKNTRPCKNDMNVDGEIIYDMGTIELREGSGECKDYQDMVFIHEVMHGIFHHMCIEQDEELIKKISMGLHQVIRDNPGIFINDRNLIEFETNIQAGNFSNKIIEEISKNIERAFKNVKG